MIRTAIAAALLCGGAAICQAQTQQPVAEAPAVQPAPASSAAPTAAFIVGGPEQNVLRAGTPIALTMSEELTTKGKKLRVGQRFQMEVQEPVTVQGHIVIPAGSPATGEVTDVRNKGMWGKSGHINARLLFVRANGRQIRLSGQMDDKGVTGTGGVVAAVAFLPVAGFFTTGTSAKIPVGAPVRGFIDEDVTVAFAPAVVTPMTVPAATPPAAAPSPVAPAPVAADTPKKD